MVTTGICGSDSHVSTGRIRMNMPVILGHEGSGIVVEIGQNVTNVKPGDNCILSFVSSCGHCSHCLSGNGQLCATHAKTQNRFANNTTRCIDKKGNQIEQMGKLGLFSDHVIVQQECCFPVNNLPMDVAALIGCCVTSGIGAVINNPASKAGMQIAVFGCGGIGLNVIQGARLLNAKRIIAFDISDQKLEFSRNFGATDVVNLRKLPVPETIKDITDQGVDMSFDAYGSPSTTRLAFDSIRSGGTAVIIGAANSGEFPLINLADITIQQKSIVGSFYGSATPHNNFSTMIGLYMQGKIEIEKLITRRYTLENINLGMTAIKNGENGRGVVEFKL